MIHYQEIDMHNPLYQQERELRNKVLLRPFGLPDHAWEMKDGRALHFIATDKEQVVACVLLVRDEEVPEKAQLMQMAVASDYQGKNIGKAIYHFLEKRAREVDISYIKCHARENAIPFYHKMGFEIFGEEFIEVGIRHRYMQINL